MSPAAPTPRSHAFDELLWKVVDAPDDVDRLLDNADDPAAARAVREALRREVRAGELLSISTKSAPLSRASERKGPSLGRWQPLRRPDGAAPSVALVPSVALSRRRLWKVGRTLFVLTLPFLALLTATHLPMDRWSFLVGLEMLAAWSYLGSCLVAAWLGRNARLTDRTVQLASGVLLCVVAAQTAILHSGHELHRYDVVTGFGPFVIVIAFVPLVYHASLARTLIVAAAAATVAAVTSLAVLGIADRNPGAAAMAEMSGGLLLGVASAWAVHRGVQIYRGEVEAGLRLGSYELVERLGAGGMGEVWMARHPVLSRPAAIKLVRGLHLEEQPERRERMLRRFGREAQTIAALHSEHTVRLYDHGVTETGHAYMVMELLDGIDLRTLVESEGAQPVDRALSILLQICESLAEAHARDLVHRDVKPANVMLCRRGDQVDQVKVLDFGNVGPGPSAPEDSGSFATVTQGLFGTPAFAAPEVLSGVAADARSDIYGVGCVAYWLLTGRKVFDHDSTVMLYAAHLRDAPQPIEATRKGVPVAVDELVLRCLAKDPARRPATIEELSRLLAGLPRVGDWQEADARDWWARHEANR